MTVASSPEEIWAEGERASDRDPLALAPGELVRVAPRRVGRQTNPPEEVGDHACMISRDPVDGEGLPDDRAD